MSKKLCVLLILAVLLTGCSTVPPAVPAGTTTPATTVTTTLESTEESTAATTIPTEPGTTGPLLVKDYLDSGFASYDKIKGYEVLIPDDGVLILTGEESFKEVYIDGDVYITYTADVSFRNVHVRGKVYCHGILRQYGYSAYTVYAYYNKTAANTTICSAFDGTHGQVLAPAYTIDGKILIGNDVLDYAFKTWGKGETDIPPATDPPPETPQPVVPFPTGPKDDAPDVVILSETETLMDEVFPGDVYVTSTGDIRFIDVSIWGTLYVYGKVHVSDTGKNTMINRICTYDFVGTCDAFDGTHGQVTGGPFVCKEYYVTNDALDYAFQTWGKQ